MNRIKKKNKIIKVVFYLGKDSINSKLFFDIIICDIKV